jgi:hypothetical protein
MCYMIVLPKLCCVVVSVVSVHYGRAEVCRRPGDVPMVKCRGYRQRSPQRPATELAVGIGRPAAQLAIHRRPPSTQIRPSAQHDVHRRPPSAQEQPSAQDLTSRPRRHSVTAPPGCADGYPRHNSGRRHNRLTAGPHFPPLRRLHVVPTATHDITPGRWHNIWTFFIFTLFLLQR